MTLHPPICDITPFTLQDFPGHTAAILWFTGCNLRCRYCHNPDLVHQNLPRLDPDVLGNFLEKRKGKIEGIVLSGGECTLYPSLLSFTSQLQARGFLVKIDTNGLQPQMLHALLTQGSIDYLALDYKAPQKKFFSLTGSASFSLFLQSLQLTIQAKIPVEIRTTIHSDLLDIDDLQQILDHLESLGFKGKYFLQHFQLPPQTLDACLGGSSGYDLGKLQIPSSFVVGLRNFSSHTSIAK